MEPKQHAAANLQTAAGHLPAAPTAHLRSGTETTQALARYSGVLEETVALARAACWPPG